MVERERGGGGGGDGELDSYCKHNDKCKHEQQAVHLLLPFLLAGAVNGSNAIAQRDDHCS